MLAKPRFVNPHFLPASTTIVTRKDAFSDDGEIKSGCAHSQMTDPLVLQLHQLIQTSVELDSNLEENSTRRKRRRIVSELPCTSVGSNEPLLFRLVSRSLPPRPVLLEPKPPPPPVTREPDCEDNKAQAVLRKKRSRAAAVDFSWIVGESLKPHHPRPSKSFHAKASLPNPVPVMMIVQRDQPVRMTRPPVPASQLVHHPYASDASVLPVVEPTKSSHWPRIGAVFLPPDDPPVSTKQRRRKRGKMFVKDRPPPTFWRSNPACQGKGLGYAMGYPCSSGEDCTRYRRDTMRNGIHVNS